MTRGTFTLDRCSACWLFREKKKSSAWLLRQDKSERGRSKDRGVANLNSLAA